MHYAVEIWEYTVIGGAALSAGVVNSIAGGGSVITFPALLWAGVPAVTASATNSVGLWPGVISALFGFRSELPAALRREVLLVVPSLVGGFVGAFVLLSTPSDFFRSLAPWLVLLAALLIALQEPLAARLRRGEGRAAPPRLRWWLVGAAAQFAIAAYGGYFGAGMGILMLATLGLLGLTDIHLMNALKNLFAVAIKGTAIVYLSVRGAVDWDVAGVMVVASVVGGYAGAAFAYRVGRVVVRRAVVVTGIIMALSLFLRL